MTIDSTAIGIPDPSVYTNDLGNPTNGERVLQDVQRAYTRLNDFMVAMAAATDGAYSVNNIKTFTAGIKTPTVDETVVGAGVVIDNTLIKDGSLGGLLQTREGLYPTYANANAIMLRPGLAASSDASGLMISQNILAPSLVVAGANGLDTGAKAANTWYYVYLVGKTDGTVASLFSVTNESVSGSITLPSGYSRKRQLPIAVRTNASNNIIPFFVSEWGLQPTFQWLVNAPYVSGTLQAGGLMVVSGGNSGTPLTVDLSMYVPPIAKKATLLGQAEGNHFQGGLIQPVGISHSYDQSLPGWCFIYTDTYVPTQTIQYQRYAGTGLLSLYVQKFTVTEIV